LARPSPPTHRPPTHRRRHRRLIRRRHQRLHQLRRRRWHRHAIQRRVRRQDRQMVCLNKAKLSPKILPKFCPSVCTMGLRLKFRPPTQRPQRRLGRLHRRTNLRLAAPVGGCCPTCVGAQFLQEEDPPLRHPHQDQGGDPPLRHPHQDQGGDPPFIVPTILLSNASGFTPRGDPNAGWVATCERNCAWYRHKENWLRDAARPQGG
jgi:hypothetical protein